MQKRTINFVLFYFSFLHDLDKNNKCRSLLYVIHERIHTCMFVIFTLSQSFSMSTCIFFSFIIAGIPVLKTWQKIYDDLLKFLIFESHIVCCPFGWSLARHNERGYCKGHTNHMRLQVFVCKIYICLHARTCKHMNKCNLANTIRPGNKA